MCTIDSDLAGLHSFVEPIALVQSFYLLPKRWPKLGGREPRRSPASQQSYGDAGWQSPRWSVRAYSTGRTCSKQSRHHRRRQDCGCCLRTRHSRRCQDAARRGPDRPGFIDTQVNGGGGVLFNEVRTAAGIAALARRTGKYGTTGYLPTLITGHTRHMAEALSATRAADAQGVRASFASTSKAILIRAEGRARPEVHARDGRTTTSRWPRRCRPAGR